MTAPQTPPTDEVLDFPALTQENAVRNDWGKWIRRSLVLLTLMMAGYLAVGIWAVRGDLVHAREQLPIRVLPGVIGLVALGMVLRALRWHYYVRLLRWQVPLGSSMAAFFASFAFTATPGKAGEMVKAVLLRTRHKVSVAEGAGVLLVERLGDLLAVLVLAAGGLALMTDAYLYFIGTIVAVGGATIFVSNRRLHVLLFSRLARFRRLAWAAERCLRLLDTGRRLLSPIPFLVGVGMALIAWSCEGIAFYGLLAGFGMPVHPVTACSIFGIATLVGALSALPGGLGSFEVVMVLLLSRMGFAVSAATLPVVVFRVCTLWLGSFLGLIVLLGWLYAASPAGLRIRRCTPTEKLP